MFLATTIKVNKLTVTSILTTSFIGLAKSCIIPLRSTSNYARNMTTSWLTKCRTRTLQWRILDLVISTVARRMRAVPKLTIDVEIKSFQENSFSVYNISLTSRTSLIHLDNFNHFSSKSANHSRVCDLL